MPRMLLTPRPATAMAIKARLELARHMEMPEEELEDVGRQLEADPVFETLIAAGVLGFSGFPAARFAARHFAGYGLSLSGSGLPEFVDGNCDLVRLMQSIGHERFTEWFLGEASHHDEQRARGCGISVEEARKLREFMDRAFIQGEFAGPAAPAPEKVFSAVAGIELEGGEPVLAFFHREVWKRRHQVNEGCLAEYLHTLSQSEAAKVRGLLGRLKLVEQRKTTLYGLLEGVLRIQADYLRTGEPTRRQPLMQKSMAATLGVHPSVINRLISNKSIQMPWGLEAPLGVFFPSAKDINRERICEMALAHPSWNDERLRFQLGTQYGALLSRRSVAQYRQEASRSQRTRRGDTTIDKPSSF